MLMGPDQGAVDHHVFLVRILGQDGQQVSRDAFASPSAEPTMNILEVSKLLRKVSPGNTCAISIQDSIDEQPIVPSCNPNMSNATRQDILDPVPLVVSNTISQHGS